VAKASKVAMVVSVRAKGASKPPRVLKAVTRAAAKAVARTAVKVARAVKVIMGLKTTSRSKEGTMAHERIPSDNYNTPPAIAKWTVDRCAKISEKYCGAPQNKLLMLEPGCGDNAPFSRYASSINMNAFGVDSRPVPQRSTVTIFSSTDFLELPGEVTAAIFGQKYDVIATNPPFIFGIEFILRCLDILSSRGIAAFNMKLSFLATQGRMSFFQERPPSEVHILSKRPSYAHGGKTDAAEYCVLFWNGVDIDKKIRAERGRLTRVYWQNNKRWPTPVLEHDLGSRVIVEK
jgi:hypothetical protein